MNHAIPIPDIKASLRSFSYRRQQGKLPFTRHTLGFVLLGGKNVLIERNIRNLLAMCEMSRLFQTCLTTCATNIISLRSLWTPKWIAIRGAGAVVPVSTRTFSSKAEGDLLFSTCILAYLKTTELFTDE